MKEDITFGINEFFNLEFWIKRNSKYNYIDFIHFIYELNLKTQDMEEQELIESLARFLCGYDLQIKDRNNITEFDLTQQHNYFQNQKINIDTRVTNEMLTQKIMMIKGLLTKA